MESDNHTNLTDEQLDDLIRQTFCRQQVVEEINHSVMKQLHRTMRRRRLLRWGKIALFSFGLPLLLLLVSMVSRQPAKHPAIFHLPLASACIYLSGAARCHYALCHMVCPRTFFTR